MTDSHQQEYANVTDSRRLSAVWLVPLLALVVGLWMLFQQWHQQGPTITINFQSATGLEKGKTKIKTRDLDIGLVTDIRLTEQHDGVIVTAEINKSAANLLKSDTKLWVVSPRITRSGVSGLNTLLSGAYIKLAPGSATDEEDHFIGLNEPPVTPAGTPGKHITLTSFDRFEYSVGDPVVYKGLTVGQFEEVHFDVDKKSVSYDVFIEAPYHQLIDSNTRFWNASGVSVKLGADGIDVKTSSLISLLTNAVSFGQSLYVDNVPGENDKESYAIYSNEESANTPSYQFKDEYIILVSDSVRGLSVGAPVDYRGIKIGEVLAVNYQPLGHPGSLLEQDYKIPVLISIVPGLVGLPDSVAGKQQVRQQNSLWIEQGLKAQLQTGNLITGQLYVQLQHYPDEPAGEVASYHQLPIIPSTPDDFSQFAHQASDLLDKFNDLPLQELTGSADDLLSNLSTTVTTLNKAGEDFRTLMEDINQETLIKQLNQTMIAFSQLAEDYSSGSSGYDELVGTMETLNQRLLDLKPLLRTLNNKPNSLVFSAAVEKDRQPQAATKR